MERVEQLNKTALAADLNPREAAAQVSEKYRAIPSIVAALVVPAIFLVYVARYTVNVPIVDVEWLLVQLL